MTVSVVLPTYNEADTIRSIVATVRQHLEGHARSHEVLVVDDDSPDGTAQRVQSVYEDTEAVRTIVRTEESGLSSAVVRGFRAADGDVLAVMDADGQHDPGQLPALVIQVAEGNADLAVGSRRCETGRVAAEWPYYRRVVSHGATALAWAAIPPARELTDPMSGFFAVDASLVDPDRLEPCGYKILLELLGRCPLDDIREVGYVFRDRTGGSSNLGPAEYWRYVQHLGRLVVPSRRAASRRVETPAVEVDE